MSDDFAQFNAAFFEEAAEHIAVMETGLLELEQRPSDLDLLNKIFRSAHSIKGVAGMLGFTPVAQFTHKMETLLDQLRTGRITVTQPMTDLLLQSTDCLKALIEAAQQERTVDEAMVYPLEVQLAEAAAGTSPAPATGHTSSPAAAQSAAEPERGERPAPSGIDSPSSPLPPIPSPGPAMHHFTIAWTPPAFLFQRGLDPQQIFKELGDLGTLSQVTVDRARLPNLAEMDPETCYLSWSMQLETAKDLQVVEAVFEFVREDSVLSISESTVSSPKFQVSSVQTLAPQQPETRNQKLETRNSSATPDGDPKPLGEILVEAGVVSRETLDHALAQQKRVGEILIEQHAATPQQISQALQKQQDNATHVTKKGTDTASIRVDTAKIDKLINLVGELVITQSMLSDLSTRFEMSQLAVLLERVAQLERNTREIQERVMGIRMLPIGSAFSRFPRLVRDLSGKSG